MLPCAGAKPGVGWGVAWWGEHMGGGLGGDKGSPQGRGYLALRREGGLALLTLGAPPFFVPESPLSLSLQFHLHFWASGFLSP